MTGLSLLAFASPSFGSIEQAKSLQCSGNGEALSITFDHVNARAMVMKGSTLEEFRYEPQGAFLTWRLIDTENRQRYVVRQGDAMNGDFGWYFETSTVDADGNVQMKPGGECRLGD